MKDENIMQIMKELTEHIKWMKDSVVCDDNTTLEQLIENSDDIYEVILDIHLINGDVVTLKNECVKSFEHKMYMGAYFDDDINDDSIIANICMCVPTYHSIQIPLMSICWIDAYSKDVDWKKYKENLNKIENGK